MAMIKSYNSRAVTVLPNNLFSGYKLKMEKSSFGKGVFFAIFAYLLWGFLPIYWKILSGINSMHILGFRIILSLLLVGCLLFASKNTSWLKFYKDRQKIIITILTSLTITFNWGLYIWAVNGGHTIESAIGYYINPLLSIVLGMIFFREKLKILQLLAFIIALVGVLILTILTGRPPWIPLGLAFSFALYGLLKKKVHLTALESLGVETLVASPIGILLLLIPFGTNRSFPDPHSLAYIMELPLKPLLFLLLCGLVTSFPLYLFAKGAKMLPLSTLGFVQFLSPTLSFITGFFIFGESFPIQNFLALGCIWIAVILYTISLKGFNGTRPHE
jgi:chloramphenicol-sensitive protein RarD